MKGSTVLGLPFDDDFVQSFLFLKYMFVSSRSRITAFIFLERTRISSQILNLKQVFERLLFSSIKIGQVF